MLIETLYQNYKRQKTKEDFINWYVLSKHCINKALLLLIISIILIILLVPFAIYLTLRIANKQKWNVYITVLIIISFFTPYIGFFTTLFAILYGLINY